MGRYPKRSRIPSEPAISSSKEEDERFAGPIINPEHMNAFLESRLKSGISHGSLTSDKGPPPLPKNSKRRRVTYENDVDDCIPPIGFTRLEYNTILSHMFRHDFEHYEPLPKKNRRLKAYLDQIRETRGYGVTIFAPLERTYSLIVPIFKTWEKDIMLKFYIPKMVETLGEAMKNKFMVRYRNREEELARNLRVVENMVLTNVVECSNVRVYLLSFNTPDNPTDGNVVEAMFAMVGSPVVGEPVASPINFVLKEWKLKRGEHLVYSSSLTNGGMKMFSLICGSSASRSKQVC